MIPPEIANDLGAGHAFVDLVEDYLVNLVAPPDETTCS